MSSSREHEVGLEDDLKRSLCDLGLRPGHVVMTHASLRRLGLNKPGQGEILLQVLLDAVQPGGAIMAYIGCPSPYDHVGRKNNKGQPLESNEDQILNMNPLFDPQTTAADPGHGAFAEIIRKASKAITSDHISWRMTAIGDRADELVREVPLHFGADFGSPLHRLATMDVGHVLLLGSHPDHTTLLHYAEGRTRIADKRQAKIKVVLMMQGRRAVVPILEHDSSNGIIDWPEPYFERIIHDYLASGQPSRTGPVGGTIAHLFPAGPLVEFAVAHMERTAVGLGHHLDSTKSERWGMTP
jgi:aminoglycoside 3-N-acetyltransferase